MKRALCMVLLLLATPLVAVTADQPPKLPNGSAVVGFEVKNVILFKGQINKSDALWMLDTGFTHSTVTPEAAQKAQVEVSGKAGNRVGACTYGVGDAMLKGHEVRVLKLPELSLVENLGADRSGVLGHNYLREYVTTIDFGKKQITFIPQAAAPATEKEEGSEIINFTLNKQLGAILVKMKINGIESPLPFLFDTGSSETCVSAAIAQRMKFRTVKKKTSIGPYPVTTLKSLELGGLAVQDFDVLPGDPPQTKMLHDNGIEIGGFLGRTFLEHFNWTIDYRTNVIRMTPINK